MQKLVATSLASLMFAGSLVNPTVAGAQSGTSTPIKHLVVIFQENVSFDHYFGSYPKALNPAGQPRFIAKPGTPAVNGYTDGLLYNNPNALNTGNGNGAANPFRLDASRSRDSGGTGLGLAIVKACVEACQGTVCARNRRPAGLEVEIRLKTPAGS